MNKGSVQGQVKSKCTWSLQEKSLLERVLLEWAWLPCKCWGLLYLWLRLLHPKGIVTVLTIYPASVGVLLPILQSLRCVSSSILPRVCRTSHKLSLCTLWNPNLWLFCPIHYTVFLQGHYDFDLLAYHSSLSFPFSFEFKHKLNYKVYLIKPAFFNMWKQNCFFVSWVYHLPRILCSIKLNDILKWIFYFKKYLKQVISSFYLNNKRILEILWVLFQTTTIKWISQ